MFGPSRSSGRAARAEDTTTDGGAAESDEDGRVARCASAHLVCSEAPQSRPGLPMNQLSSLKHIAVCNTDLTQQEGQQRTLGEHFVLGSKHLMGCVKQQE